MTFSPPPVRWKSRRWLVRIGLGVLVVFFLAFLALWAPVYVPRFLYGLSAHPANSGSPEQPATVAEGISPEPSLTIPKLGVSAPVVYEPSTVEATIQKALRNGVVHYGTTAVPGQPGNVAIFGHSSNDWWKAGDYNRVFVLLDKLVPGDTVTVNYQSVMYIYEVTGSKIVKPTEFSVLNPTPTPTLTLITCTPIGTSLKRLVVTAKQVSPVPGSATTISVVPSVTPVPPTSNNDQPPEAEAALVGSDGVTTSFWNTVQTGFNSVIGR